MMSFANAYSTLVPEFGFAGPGFNAYHVDRMGWIPRSRILTFGADGIGARSVTLAALNHPEAEGPLQVRIPFDPADPFHYYTVEFRRRDGWDAGIPGDVVLIHEIARRPLEDCLDHRKRPSDKYLSYLLRNPFGTQTPLDSLAANGVLISVDNIDAANQATITISSDIVDRCLQGYVWREARPSDRVCVTGAVRTQTARDNSLAASRRLPGGGDTCRAGYVWREAFPGDRVCVAPATRARAAADNAEADNRRNPARFVYGPNTCRVGFVWREADDRDYVCVTDAVREQTRSDNLLAPSRRQPGGDTCKAGYVWRGAFPGDRVCVTSATRLRAELDNAAASDRLLRP